MAVDKIQNVIIGSGEGGKYLAWHLAGAGEQTVVIERRLIGGSCPNTNCLPSKNEIWSAKVADLVRHAGRFGTRVDSSSIDIAAVRRAQPRDGRWPDQNASRQVQSQRRAARDGQRQTHRAAHDRSAAQRRRLANDPRRAVVPQPRHARDNPRRSRPGRCKAADTHRDARAGSCAGASHCHRRRICRPGIRTGLPALRQPRDDRAAQRATSCRRRCGCRRGSLAYPHR